MNDDDLDRIWRDGLARAADHVATTGGARTRVTARVRRRRRNRRAASAGAVAALATTTIVGVAELHPGRSRVHVATTVTTSPPIVRAVVRVDDAPGGALTMEFPGRTVAGNPATISLPSGVVRFVIHDGAPGHLLVIDGVPGFDVDLTTQGETITKDVRLSAGVYDLHCAIPGHEEAGEKILLVVTDRTG